MKIALAQLNYHIGNFEENTRKIVEAIGRARAEKADIVVFAELAVTGYPPRDFLEFDDFLRRVKISIDEIASHCTGITAIVGAPSINPDPKGKNLHNSAYFLADGKIKQVIHKALLPTYDIFDEYRYFQPAAQFGCVHHNGRRIAVVVCEDSWDIEDDPMYTINPMDELIKENPEMIINISASPFSYTHPGSRKRMLKWNTSRYNLPMIYVNHTGAQTELIFDGGSMVCTAEGGIACEMKYFKEDFRVIDTDALAVTEPEIRSDVQNIHDALVSGIRDYFRKLGFQKAVLGLSGGIDSAVTAVLAAEALGRENVHGVLMPSQYSSGHSVSDAKALAVSLGIRHDIIPIREIYSAFENSLKDLFAGLPEDVAEENIQARIRGVLVMALANKFRYVLLNTSNKSEVAVGYGTLYGDMCGGISVLGDVYKTKVYELAQYINRNEEIIPVNSIVKPPSAELRPGQKDSDSLPEYDILDKILFQYIENRKGPAEITAMGFDSQLVSRVLRLVNTNEYKRQQTPPILRVSDKAFGTGRRMPVVGKYLS